VHPVDLSAGVAVRLSEFCLDDDGRLGDFPLWHDAVRAALLVDLAFAGRLVQTDDSIVLDGAPTGFPPADRLLAAIAAEDEHPLDWWMAHGDVGLRDIAAENVAHGRWTMRYRFLGRRYESAPYDWSRDSDLALDPRRPPEVDPPTAAVLALGLAIGATDPPPERPGEELLRRTGPVRWICEASVEHLTTAHRRNLALASALRLGDTPGPA
jgi:hypothetical protein